MKIAKVFFSSIKEYDRNTYKYVTVGNISCMVMKSLLFDIHLHEPYKNHYKLYKKL